MCSQSPSSFIKHFMGFYFLGHALLPVLSPQRQITVSCPPQAESLRGPEQPSASQQEALGSRHTWWLQIWTNPFGTWPPSTSQPTWYCPLNTLSFRLGSVQGKEVWFQVPEGNNLPAFPRASRRTWVRNTQKELEDLLSSFQDMGNFWDTADGDPGFKWALVVALSAALLSSS